MHLIEIKPISVKGNILVTVNNGTDTTVIAKVMHTTMGYAVPTIIRGREFDGLMPFIEENWDEITRKTDPTWALFRFKVKVVRRKGRFIISFRDRFKEVPCDNPTAVSVELFNLFGETGVSKVESRQVLSRVATKAITSIQ